MLEFVVSIIFVLSLGGVSLILVKKIPKLSSLPYDGSTGIKKHRIILNIEERLKRAMAYVENQIFWHKLLSWVKVMTLRIETRVDTLLHKIRKKAQLADKDKNGKK